MIVYNKKDKKKSTVFEFVFNIPILQNEYYFTFSKKKIVIETNEPLSIYPTLIVCFIK